MATRSFIAGDKTTSRLGPAPAVGRLLRYQLNVVGSTTQDVVESAGGWLCDRARAGWDVNVLVADGGDPRPLTILGATAIDLDDGFLSMVRSASRGGALAVSTDLLAADARVRDEVVRVLKRGLTQVTVWGRLAGRIGPSGRPGPAPGELGRTGFQVARACRRRCFDGCGHSNRSAFPDRDGILPPAVLRVEPAT